MRIDELTQRMLAESIGCGSIEPDILRTWTTSWRYDDLGCRQTNLEEWGGIIVDLGHHRNPNGIL